jgi:hypothetical protein
MLVSRLRQRLQELSADLNSRLQGVHAKATQLLEYSQGGSHLTFTPHGSSHVSAVELNYDWLLGEADIAGFNAVEIFCLLGATFFHDALMIPARSGGESEARGNHAESARSFLMKNRELIGLTLHEADIIGDIIRGHSMNDLSALPEQVVLGSQIVDTRKLSACLSLADITHADSSRAPEIVFQHLDLDEDSSYHWKRHLQISGITRKADSLLMSALVFSEEGEHAVEEYRGSIEKQLRIVKPYFDSVLQPIRRVELNVKHLDSPLDQTLRFQTNTPGVLKVLIEGVYDREDVFVRELVQNSLDACLVRRLKLERRNLQFSPQILLTFFRDKKRLKAVRIDDNGVGMDLNDVRDTVLWIGSSIANQRDVAELVRQAAGRNLIATFGIGLLSCFKASSRITLRTAKERATALQFELTSVSDAIKPEKSHDDGIGTTIIVEIPEDGLQLTPSATTSHYFKKIHQADLRLMELDWSDELAAQTRENLGKIARTEAKVIAPNVYPPTGAVVHIEVSGDDYHGAFWIYRDNLKALRDTEGKIDILNEGVFVAAEDASDWLAEHLAFLSGYINFSARSLNLPAGRDRVIKDDVFRRKAAEISARAALRLIDALVQQSRAGGEAREQSALVLSLMYTWADVEARSKVLKGIDNYCVRIYKSPVLMCLGDIRRSNRSIAYLHYPKGRWVEDLTEFDGKMLYHKQDDLTDLQAALMSQDGQLVIAAARDDAGEVNDQLLEATVISAYLEEGSVSTVDLSVTNILEGKYRSKPVPQAVRQRILKSVKFVDISQMPNKISWRVGAEIWINTAHPVVSRIYSRLGEQPTDTRTAELAEVLVNILSYDLSGAFENLSRVIEES